MIKLRLWGEADEIQKLKAYFKSLPKLRVKSCSDGYKDRGESVYERVYMEVELRPVATINPEFEKLFEDTGKTPAPERTKEIKYFWQELESLADEIERTDLLEGERFEGYTEAKEEALWKLDEARIILRNLKL